MKCYVCTVKDVVLRKNISNMAKDITKLFEDIEKYKQKNNVKSISKLATEIDNTLPHPFLCKKTVKARFSNWKNGKQTMDDGTYNVIRMFLDNKLNNDETKS